jgi:hypothetical protein
MKSIQFAIGISDDGMNLVMKRNDPAQPNAFEAEMSFVQLDQIGFADASRMVGETALLQLAVHFQQEFSGLIPVLPSPSDDDIELATQLMQRAVREQSKLYVPVIDRLMQTVAGRTPSTHPFTEAWPVSREIIQKYPDDPAPVLSQFDLPG